MSELGAWERVGRLVLTSLPKARSVPWKILSTDVIRKMEAIHKVEIRTICTI